MRIQYAPVHIANLDEAIYLLMHETGPSEYHSKRRACDFLNCVTGAAPARLVAAFWERGVGDGLGMILGITPSVVN